MSFVNCYDINKGPEGLGKKTLKLGLNAPRTSAWWDWVPSYKTIPHSLTFKDHLLLQTSFVDS
jgi:hypothetical protein